MMYGMLASGSCLLSEVVLALQEDTKKTNTIDRSGVLQINRYEVCSAHSLSFPVIIKHFFKQILDKSAACICREFLVGVILPFICKITYAFCNDNKRFWIGCMRCGISNKKIQHIYHSIYTSKNIAHTILFIPFFNYFLLLHE